MGADFPVPRTQLPRVEVTPHERQARQVQMERMLVNAVDAFDRFRDVDHGRVDPTRWKLVDSQDALRVFREREVGSSGHGSSYSASASSLAATDDDSMSHSSHGLWEDIPYEAVSAAALVDGRRKIKSLLMVGDMPGRVESVVYAAITKTNHELAMVQTFLHDDIADCAILNELEGPTQENPLQFLGYKWFVKKSPGGGRLVKHRDVVYLESCGMTTNRAGEAIGYLLIESVDLPSFPELTNRNCVRAVQSVSILMRQKSETVIDVFVTGVVEPSGKIMRPITSMLTSQAMFMLTKAMDLAECKRLTKMVISQRRARDDVLYNSKHKATACSLCHQKRKFYNGVSLVDCSVCGHVICTRCQTHKRVFIADGVLGRFHRVGCCKTCVLAADRMRPTAKLPPMKMSISAHMQRQNSSRDFDAMDSFSVSRPRSSSDSSVGDLNEYTVNQSLQTTVEEELIPVEAARSRRGSVDHASSRPQNSPGITLLPASSLTQDRSLLSRANAPSRAVPSTSAVVPQGHPLQRQRSGSSTADRYLLTQGQAVPAPQPIRPSPSPTTFTSSAPAGTYDLRGQMGHLPSTPVRPTTTQASSQQDLFARMMELRRLAESTYQTTQQNERIMQQQRTPSHASQAGQRPQGRFA